MGIDRIAYLLQYMDYLRKTSTHSDADYEKIEDLIIRLFCCSKIKPSRKKPRLHECKCYSELPIYLVNGWHRRTNQTLTLRFSGRYVIQVTIQLKGTGLVYVEVVRTPTEELNPPLVLKTTTTTTSPLSGFLLSLLK